VSVGIAHIPDILFLLGELPNGRNGRIGPRLDLLPLLPQILNQVSDSFGRIGLISIFD